MGQNSKTCFSTQITKQFHCNKGCELVLQKFEEAKETIRLIQAELENEVKEESFYFFVFDYLAI